MGRRLTKGTFLAANTLSLMMIIRFLSNSFRASSTTVTARGKSHCRISGRRLPGTKPKPSMLAFIPNGLL